MGRREEGREWEEERRDTGEGEGRAWRRAFKAASMISLSDVYSHMYSRPPSHHHTPSHPHTHTHSHRLLTLWFDYGHLQEVHKALLDGIRTIDIDTWLQVVTSELTAAFLSSSFPSSSLPLLFPPLFFPSIFSPSIFSPLLPSPSLFSPLLPSSPLPSSPLFSPSLFSLNRS